MDDDAQPPTIEPTTAIATTVGPPSVGPLLTTCSPGVGIVLDIREDDQGLLLVAGSTGLASCNATTGAAQMISAPSAFMIAYIKTRDGTSWGTDLNHDLYRKLPGGNWGLHLNSIIITANRLGIGNDGNLTVIDVYGTKLHKVRANPPHDVIEILDLTTAATWGEIGGLGMLASGQVAVGDKGMHCVYVFTPQGAQVATLGTCGLSGSAPGKLDDPYEMGLDTQGRILVADRDNDRISVFTEGGAHLTDLLEGQMGTPRAVCVTSNEGHVVVPVEPSNDLHIYEYN